MLNIPSIVGQHNHCAISSSISGSSSSSSVDQNQNPVDPLLQQQHSNLKTYLIEKLLNEQDDVKPIKVEAFINKKSASKEDLVSETGTYTIEEKHSDLVGVVNKEDMSENNEQDQILSSIDLMSARAAIDEKFGISSSGTDSVINEEMTSSKLTVLEHKRQMQKIVRERNKTYSLTHDLAVHLNQQIVEQNIAFGAESVGNSLTKATTYDVIANNLEINGESTLTDGGSVGQSLDLDTTVTSQVSSTKSGVNTELLLGNTEQLIETIKKRRSDKKLLLQQRLDNANNCIKNSSKHTLSPSSSSCSSSTTMSIEKDPRSWTIPSNTDDSQQQTTRATIVNAYHSNSKPANSHDNSSYSEDEKQSNASSENHLHSQRRGNGGLAFDYILSDERGPAASRPSQPQRLTSANIQRHRSATRNSNAGFNSQQNTPSQVTNKTSSSTSSRAASSRSNHQSITRNFGQKHGEDSESNVTNLTEFATPKSSMSLGARIAAKASGNNSESSSPTKSNESTPRTPVRRRASDNSVQPPSVTASVNSSNNGSSHASPYTNRTLFLRQQSALAKRESLSCEGSKKQQVPLNGILKKPTPTANGRSVPRASSKQPSRGTSRNTSPNSHTSSTNLPSHQSPLMTGSLNLPYGASLSSYTDQRGSFQRRKNYDPIKAVEMEKQNRMLQQKKPVTSPYRQQQQLQTSASQSSMCSTENERRMSYDYDSMSDSSFSIPVQSLKANINNKQTPCNIVRKIKGRSISVTPKSTVIRPDISNWSRPVISSYSDAAKAGIMVKKEYSAPIDRSVKPSSPLHDCTKREYSAPIDRTKSPALLEDCSKKEYSIKLPLTLDDSSIKTIELDLISDTLESNTEIMKSYEKILQSTLQRLCIRLIQMSTGVLDKIGDENSSPETSSFNSTESTELERMQQLAKLVHSMQLVHDHIQIIDTSLFNQRPNEEIYMKELSKIRQEVENLKQNASANNSVVSNNSNLS